jgi:hypothetical protein
MFNDLFQVTHATGTIEFRPDAITGVNEYEMDGKKYSICRSAYEVIRNDFGNLTYKGTQLLEGEEPDDYSPAGFSYERAFLCRPSDDWGSIYFSEVDQNIKNPGFRYLLRVQASEYSTLYFVRTPHDLAELLTKFKVLSEAEQ